MPVMRAFIRKSKRDGLLIRPLFIRISDWRQSCVNSPEGHVKEKMKERVTGMDVIVRQNQLNPQKTTLLLFDFLNGHIKKTDLATQQRYEPVIRNAANLLQAARSKSMMVAYAVANHREDNATSAHLITDTDNRLNPIFDHEQKQKPIVVGGSWEAQVIDELQPLPNDYVVPKFRWSAFYQTYLELALRNRGIDTIVISGGSTDVGVASTAYSARDKDFNLVIVSDACTSPEKDNHDQLMNRIFPRMSRVRTTEQVIQMLGE